ncbi:MAG: NmrA family NAD(P)-binding protein [Bacteroidota bacterium]
MADPPNILVVGATGQTGSKIVGKLRQTGYTVHALVRNSPATASCRFSFGWAQSA